MFTYGYYLEKNVGDACGPIFLRTIYSQYIYTKYNITVEPWQLAFNYGIHNPERSVHDGKEENDSMLIFEECNHKICGSMVHLIVATVESILATVETKEQLV